jgi:hypothetical protein
MWIDDDNGEQIKMLLSQVLKQERDNSKKLAQIEQEIAQLKPVSTPAVEIKFVQIV